MTTLSPARSFPRIRCTPSNGNVDCTPTFTGPDTRSDDRKTVWSGTGVYSELIPLIRTLAPVDDFSENNNVSLNSKDCEAPVSLKILIGTESVISRDNDTEPS